MSWRYLQDYTGMHGQQNIKKSVAVFLTSSGRYLI
jgi:hypothetical protein